MTDPPDPLGPLDEKGAKPLPGVKDTRKEFELALRVTELFEASGLSAASQREALKLVAQRLNLRVTSAFVPLAPTVRGGSPAGAPLKRGKAPEKKLRSPEETKLISDLEACKASIRREAATIGKQLPADHELIVERIALLARLRAFRD